MRRISSLAAAVLITLLLLWGAAWGITQYVAKQWLLQLTQRQTLQYSNLFLHGDLFHVRIILQHVVWHPSHSGQITAPEIVLTLRPGNLWRYHVTSTQPLELRQHAAQTDWVLTAQSLDAQLSLHDQFRWARFAATLGKTTLKQQVANAPAPALLESSALQFNLEQPASPPGTHLESGLSFALAVQEASLITGLPAIAPQKLQALTLNARLLGAPPGWRNRAQIERWRAEGGTLELDALDFSWGQLSGRMQATFSLDKSLQPEGAGTAQLMLASAEPPPDDLFKSHATLKTFFDLMARTDAKTGIKSVTLPLGLQQKRLMLGMFPLGTLPDVIWPE